MPTNPTTETIVCNTDHTQIVCFNCKPKYSRTIQNPASLTWQKNTEPAPMARATNELCVAANPAIIGARMPAVVVVATVAEPVAWRRATAISQASSR
ncbi:hypothetical protein PFLL34_01181 [Pseudomonas fluorescens]|nr:hypothetical protein PFLL34_01181 [Pseudomonas fluorescens]